MRSIKKIYNASYAPIADLITYSPLPNNQIEQIDPFLFLNHHGYQNYKPNNSGLPFGPHPHRGMETVTFILKGDISHKDTGGHESVINAGGVQWMTAGRGLIHAEISSDKFKKEGGELEILQLWLNLPSKLKMTDPFYKGLQRKDIPSINLDDNVTINLISGEWFNHKGAFDSLTNTSLATIYFKPEGKLSIDIPESDNIFFYVVKGDLEVNNQKVESRQLVEFNNDQKELIINANSDAIIILGHAQPLKEKVVAHGPFVMNSQQEIIQAFNDYQLGKFGHWQE